jgi:dCMP deaminase
MNNKDHKWDLRFLELAKLVASWSKDPSTKVGAVIVGPDGEIRSTGFNGFPRGVDDTDERLSNREEKLSLVVHAEMNAILNATRFGTRIQDCTMYVAATDQSGAVWGGSPCTRCTVEVIQSGISTIISYPKKSGPSRWHSSMVVAESLLKESGVKFVEVEMPEPKGMMEAYFANLGVKK